MSPTLHARRPWNRRDMPPRGRARPAPHAAGANGADSGDQGDGLRHASDGRQRRHGHARSCTGHAHRLPFLEIPGTPSPRHTRFLRLGVRTRCDSSPASLARPQRLRKPLRPRRGPRCRGRPRRRRDDVPRPGERLAGGRPEDRRLRRRRRLACIARRARRRRPSSPAHTALHRAFMRVVDVQARPEILRRELRRVRKNTSPPLSLASRNADSSAEVPEEIRSTQPSELSLKRRAGAAQLPTPTARTHRHPRCRRRPAAPAHRSC